MTQTAPNINRFWADLIVEELVRNGVRHFFIAPGSRSSPLVSAVASNDRAEATIHFDERGTAFAALGYGRATGMPAAWITTSGTAAANGLPAMVEAAQSHVPLIAITADRPPELRDVGANQAIDQNRLFGIYPKWFFDFPCPTTQIDPSFVLTTVDQAVHRAIATAAGPVHLNCPFREPLAPSHDDVDLPEPPARWLGGSKPYTEHAGGHLAASRDELAEISEMLRRVQRGVLVVGEISSPETAGTARAFASRLGWPVLADVTSQLRLGSPFEALVEHPHLVCAARAESSSIEMVLRIGGAVSSKEISAVADRPNVSVIAIQDQPERRDPGHRVSRVVRCELDHFCAAVSLDGGSGDGEWLRQWTDAGQRIRRYLHDYHRSDVPLSEPSVAATLARIAGEDHALFLASSMPIRDVDMFAASGGPPCRVLANRGASGIDGTIAAAAGFQIADGSPVTLLVGDLATLHDLNSLALAAETHMVVVVVNNGGGGIFSFLPIADHPQIFDPWFTASHAWTFEHAAKLFHLPYERPSTLDDFERAYKTAVESKRTALVEVRTDRAENREIHSVLRAGALAAVGNAPE